MGCIFIGYQGNNSKHFDRPTLILIHDCIENVAENVLFNVFFSSYIRHRQNLKTSLEHLFFRAKKRAFLEKQALCCDHRLRKLVECRFHLFLSNVHLRG